MGIDLASIVANDYQITDNTETVTLLDTAGSTVATVQYAHRGIISDRDIAASGGYYLHGDLLWVLGANQLPAGAQPLGGYAIQDADSIKWKLIGDAKKGPLNISWVCVTRKAR